jgi:hypothetical protein
VARALADPGVIHGGAGGAEEGTQALPHAPRLSACATVWRGRVFIRCAWRADDWLRMRCPETGDQAIPPATVMPATS